jgi:hypothetical protein
MPNQEFSFASEVFNLAGQIAAPVIESIPLDAPIHFEGHTIVITHDLTAGAFPFGSTVRSASGSIVGGGWHDTAEASLAAAKALAEA